MPDLVEKCAHTIICFHGYCSVLFLSEVNNCSGLLFLLFIFFGNSCQWHISAWHNVILFSPLSTVNEYVFMVQARGIQIRENVKNIGAQVLEQVVRGAYSANGTGKNMHIDLQGYMNSVPSLVSASCVCL